MKREQDRKVWKLKRGGGPLSFFGVVITAMGGFSIYAVLDDAFSGSGDVSLDILLLGIAIPFTLVGVIAAFIREGIIIDAGKGIACRWWGLLLPMRKKIYNLNDFKIISIVRERGISGPGGKGSLYTIYLEATGESRHKLVVDNMLEHSKAQKVAEEIAVLLNIEIGK